MYTYIPYAIHNKSSSYFIVEYRKIGTKIAYHNRLLISTLFEFVVSFCFFSFFRFRYQRLKIVFVYSFICCCIPVIVCIWFSVHCFRTLFDISHNKFPLKQHYNVLFCQLCFGCWRNKFAYCCWILYNKFRIYRIFSVNQ